MARPRTPSAILELRGAYKKNPARRRPAEPEYDPSDCDCPDHLSPGAKAEWARVYPLLRSAGVMSPAYMAALAGYCHYYALWTDAVKKVNEFGAVIKGENNRPVKSPYAQVADQASAEYRSWAIELGLTAVSKTRASSSGTTTKQKENRFAKLAQVTAIRAAG